MVAMASFNIFMTNITYGGTVKKIMVHKQEWN